MYKVKRFSKKSDWNSLDDEYVDSMNTDKKTRKILAKGAGLVLGSGLGAKAGELIGGKMGKYGRAIGAAGGALAGGFGGYKLAKKSGKKIDEEYDEKVGKYKSLDKEGRREVRDRYDAKKNADRVARSINNTSSYHSPAPHIVYI